MFYYYLIHYSLFIIYYLLLFIIIFSIIIYYYLLFYYLLLFWNIILERHCVGSFKLGSRDTFKYQQRTTKPHSRTDLQIDGLLKVKKKYYTLTILSPAGLEIRNYQLCHKSIVRSLPCVKNFSEIHPSSSLIDLRYTQRQTVSLKTSKRFPNSERQLCVHLRHLHSG